MITKNEHGIVTNLFCSNGVVDRVQGVRDDDSVTRQKLCLSNGIVMFEPVRLSRTAGIRDSQSGVRPNRR